MRAEIGDAGRHPGIGIDGVPLTIKSLLQTRLDTLGPAKRIAQAAAVCGRSSRTRRARGDARLRSRDRSGRRPRAPSRREGRLPARRSARRGVHLPPSAPRRGRLRLDALGTSPGAPRQDRRAHARTRCGRRRRPSRGGGEPLDARRPTGAGVSLVAAGGPPRTGAVRVRGGRERFRTSAPKHPRTGRAPRRSTRPRRSSRS